MREGAEEDSLPVEKKGPFTTSVRISAREEDPPVDQ